MQTSATGISSNKGFTLLELLVVLVILAGTAALVLPRLSVMQDNDTRSSARNIATLLRYLDERAVAGRTRYQLVIDLNEQLIKVQQLSSTGEAHTPDDPFLQRNPLTGSTRLAKLIRERSGSATSGSISIPYGSGGLPEVLVLQVGTPGRQQYTVQALPVNGSVKIAEGWQEMVR